MKDFEKLIIEKNIKETAYTDLQKYLEIYKEENKEDYSELFQEVKENEVKFVLHSISYVLDDDRYEDEQYKYILVKIFLEYNNRRFAEYSVAYDLNAEYLDDYLLEI